jgi:hypothetical protein
VEGYNREGVGAGEYGGGCILVYNASGRILYIFSQCVQTKITKRMEVLSPYTDNTKTILTLSPILRRTPLQWIFLLYFVLKSLAVLSLNWSTSEMLEQ